RGGDGRPVQAGAQVGLIASENLPESGGFTAAQGQILGDRPSTMFCNVPRRPKRADVDNTTRTKYQAPQQISWWWRSLAGAGRTPIRHGSKRSVRHWDLGGYR